MRINSIDNRVIFKSGYPTFGTGHLSLKKIKFQEKYKPIENPREGLNILA